MTNFFLLLFLDKDESGDFAVSKMVSAKSETLICRGDSIIPEERC